MEEVDGVSFKGGENCADPCIILDIDITLERNLTFFVFGRTYGNVNGASYPVLVIIKGVELPPIADNSTNSSSNATELEPETNEPIPNSGTPIIAGLESSIQVEWSTFTAFVVPKPTDTDDTNIVFSKFEIKPITTLIKFNRLNRVVSLVQKEPPTKVGIFQLLFEVDDQRGKQSQYTVELEIVDTDIEQLIAIQQIDQPKDEEQDAEENQESKEEITSDQASTEESKDSILNT